MNDCVTFNNCVGSFLGGGEISSAWTRRLLATFITDGILIMEDLKLLSPGVVLPHVAQQSLPPAGPYYVVTSRSTAPETN
jgi:hypothetical protein